MHYKKAPLDYSGFFLAAFIAHQAWATPLEAQAFETTLWHLSPSSSPVDKPFRLQVLSYRYSCAHAFAQQSVQVSTGRLDMSFAAEARTDVACPAVLARQGPVFSVPALAAGAYRVFMHPQLPCHQTQAPTCLGPIPEEDAGTLLVAEPDKLAYVLDPTQVLAGGDFSLRLYMPEFTCSDVQFLRLASRREGGKIMVTFLPKGGERICKGPQLVGPSFALAGLPAGAYEIWAERLPACVEQGCDLAPVPQLAGYLSVRPKEGATRTGIIRGGSGSASRGWAAWREGGLALRLPEGAEGTWSVEVLSLSGRRLQGGSVIAGGTAVLRGIGPAEPGLVLVRFISPRRETFTLRVPKE